MGLVVVLVAMLCISFVAAQSTTEEPMTVDTIIDQLKDMVNDFVRDKAKAETLVEKIESARECLNMTGGIREEVMKKLTSGIIPTMTECAGRIKDIMEAPAKILAMKQCFTEKLQEFMKSNGMTHDERRILDNIGKCIKASVPS
ncbi:uncharacterized protein LOC119172129 isoform X2 [Rhipicephalus microplus]|uniref:uncharacterized protein LOC119172129 isoform X2 n=1 Tax=Rhipicephalus microplus TaxID=6941 RepID=UPI001886E726|nr:uncharacterized protein LOC119172129 [Rhipicephalus microplus]